TDETAEALRAFAGRITCVTQTNRGPAAARNVGLTRLGTDAVVFLDADDLLLPGALACRARLLAGVDAAIRGTEDWELWLRLAVRHEVAYSVEPTFVYRARPRTLSSDRARM